MSICVLCMFFVVYKYGSFCVVVEVEYLMLLVVSL